MAESEQVDRQKATAEGELDWPPYGRMPENFRKLLNEQVVPIPFSIGGQQATPHQYLEYINHEAQNMAEWLWPIYDQTSGRWTGTASMTARALTRADLELMALLRRYHDEEAQSMNRGLNKTHGELGLLEDDSAKPTLEIYLPISLHGFLPALRAGVDAGINRAGATHLRFKELFQRPRPFQISYMISKPLLVQPARSSFSPALISGHCFQGLVVRCTAYVLNRRQLDRSPDGVGSLQQYSVDIGDHRVFAGVHYPSDNIASWYCSLRSCDYVYGEDGQAAKEFMWEAIEQKSIVYKHLLKASQKEGSPYSEPMRRLAEEAKRCAIGG